MTAPLGQGLESKMSKIVINGIDYRTVDVPSHVELTIRYADGSVKTVDYTAGLLAKGGPRILTLAGTALKQVKDAYASAGHEVLEVRNVQRTHKLTESELADIAARIRADREEQEYRRDHNMVAGAAAGGERHDRI